MTSLASLLFFLFAGLGLVGSGLGLQRLARVRIDPALVLPLGTMFVAGAYWLSLVSSLPWLFPLGLTAVIAALFLPGPRTRAPGPSLRGVLPALVTLVALLAVAHFRWNRLAPDGDFLLDPLVTFDSAFHVGLAHELRLGYPPQLPGVSGFPLGYHLGTDLVRAAALRWADIDPWDCLTRFDVVVWALALMLTLRATCDRLGAPAGAAALVPWTLLFTDLSFLFAGNPQAHWWADLLRGNLLISLVYSNPVIPGLSLALGALIALDRYRAEEGRGYLALAALLAFALPFFKVFLGAHLLAGLVVAFALGRGGARRPLLVLAIPCALATAALVLGPGGETVETALAPLDLARVTRDVLGLDPRHGAALLPWSAFWIVASLGLRLLGVPEAARAWRGSPLAVTLGVVALSGWPLGLLFLVAAPEVLPGQTPVNDAAYLLEQSGPLLWLFTAITLARFADRPSRRLVAAALVAALAVPATVQYFVKKATTPPLRMPAPMVRAAAALREASRPGDVVLQRPGGRYPPAPVVLAGRRVPYERFTPYLTQFASKAALERRHETVYRFFRTREREEALAIADELGADFLALYAPDRIRFDATGLLEPVHEEEGARLYRLRRLPTAAQ